MDTGYVYNPEYERNEEVKTEEDFEHHIDCVIATIFEFVITEEIEPDRSLIAKTLISTRYLWAEAFISDTRSTINYQRLENLGDVFAKAIVSDLLHRTFTNMTPDQSTNAMGYFITNKFQGDILDRLTDKIVTHVEFDRDTYIPYNVEYTKGTISDLLLIDNSIVHSIEIDDRRDLYESIFACIQWSGQSVSRGIGWEWCEKFVEKVFTPYLTPEMFKVFSKSYTLASVDQIFERFVHGTNGDKTAIGAPYSKSDKQITGGRGSSIVTTISMSPGSIAFFKSNPILRYIEGNDNKERFIQFGSNVKAGDVFVVATALRKEDSKVAAATLALEKLEKEFGITQEWASRAKDMYDLEDFSSASGNNAPTQYLVGIVKEGRKITKYGTAYAKYVPSSSRETVTKERVTLKTAVMEKIKVDGYVSFVSVKNKGASISDNRIVAYMNGVRANGEVERLVGIAGDVDTFAVRRSMFEKYIGTR